MVRRTPPQAMWYQLVLSWCTMVSEVKRRGMQESKDIDYAKQHHIPHCWLPAKVMYPANSTKRFSLLTRSTSTLLRMSTRTYGMMLKSSLCYSFTICLKAPSQFVYFFKSMILTVYSKCIPSNQDEQSCVKALLNHSSEF